MSPNLRLVTVHSKTREITAPAVFAVLTSIGAWISIPLPITPVPLTLQVFFVLLSGAVLGGRLGALSQIMYMLLGLVGLPVFAGDPETKLPRGPSPVPAACSMKLPKKVPTAAPHPATDAPPMNA